MPKMYFRTGGGISVPQHQVRGMKGCGAGAVLLQNGGVGSASSYDSPTQYAEITGRRSGMGMGGSVSGLGGMRELAELKINRGSGMKKPKNINFSL